MKPEAIASAMPRSGVVRTRTAVAAAAILMGICALAAPMVAASLQQRVASAASLSWVLNGVLLLAVLLTGLALRTAAVKDRDPLRRLEQVGRLIAAAPVDITVRDKSLRMLAASAGMQRFVDIVVRNGWVRPEFIDLEFLSRDEKDQIPMPASVAAVVREYQAAVATGKARSYDFDHELEAVGIKAPYAGRVTPLLGVHGEVMGVITTGMYFLGHSQSLDDSAAARGRAERINDTKTRFLAAVSHDVRNPLNAMAGLQELASFDSAIPRQSKAMLATVRSSAQSLLRLIPSIIDIRSMERGELLCMRVPVSLRSVAEEVVALFAASAYQKGISLTLEVAPGVAACHLTDPQGLNQLLNNFLSNAIRFTESGGVRIQLDGAPVEDGLQWITLSVIDTGSGIEPHIQQKLSESRYEAGLSSSPDGAGLGLHFCQQMVRHVGGTICISSVVGQGTHVHVRLPLALGPAESREPPRAPVPELPRRLAAALRTLVVESQASNRLLLKCQLEFLGHEVQMADDGARGLALAGTDRFDLIVCDCALQDMTGLEFVRAVRADARQNASVPVLGYTADAGAEYREAGLRVGMGEVLVKPAGLRALEVAVARCLPTNAPQTDRRGAGWT